MFHGDRVEALFKSDFDRAGRVLIELIAIQAAIEQKLAGWSRRNIELEVVGLRPRVSSQVLEDAFQLWEKILEITTAGESAG